MKPLRRFPVPQRALVPIFAIGLAVPDSLANGPTVTRVENIISQITGDTGCIAKAERYWLTWKTYNDTLAAAARKGESVSRESAHWNADREYRAAWRALPPRPRAVAVATGSVTGAGRTQYGAIPANADIQVGYQFDWQVKGVYGWGSRRQPRVESVTCIKLKPEYRAEIRLDNRISMVAQGSLSGTAGKSNPWPQIATHEAKLIAIDVNGQQHQLEAKANATVTPSTSRSNTSGNSTSRSWSVNTSVGISKSGPSASVGGSVGGSTTQSQSTTEGESVPTVPGKNYSDLLQANVARTIKLDCGGSVEFGRAAQITGNFYTKSMAPHGSVKTDGTFSVSNTVAIHVTCQPCAGVVPEPKSAGSVPQTPFGGKTATPTSPVTQGGVTYTPSGGGAGHAGDWWDNPIIRGGGCIYIDPRYLPPFVEPVPEGEAKDFDYSQLPGGKIPFVIPEGTQEGDESALGHLVPGARIVPEPGTTTRVVPGLNRIVFDGPWQVIDPTDGSASPLQDGYVEFRLGGNLLLDGEFDFTAPDGWELEDIHDGRRRSVSCHDPETARSGGTITVADDSPGELIFDGGFYESEGDENDLPAVDVKLEGLRVTAGGDRSVSFRASSSDEPVSVLASLDTQHWYPMSSAIPDPQGMVHFNDPLAELPETGGRFYAAALQPSQPGELAGELDPQGWRWMVHSVPGLPHLQPELRVELGGAAQDYWQTRVVHRNLRIALGGAHAEERGCGLLLDALDAALADADSADVVRLVQAARESALTAHAGAASVAEALGTQVTEASDAEAGADAVLRELLDAAHAAIAARIADLGPGVGEPASPARTQAVLEFLAHVQEIQPDSEWIPILQQLAEFSSPELLAQLQPPFASRPFVGRIAADLALAAMQAGETDALFVVEGGVAQLFLLNADGSVTVFTSNPESGVSATTY